MRFLAAFLLMPAALMAAELKFVPENGMTMAGPFMEILRTQDTSIEIPRHSDQWKQNFDNVPSFGLVKDVIWFRFSISAPADQDVYLNIPNPTLHDIRLFVLDETAALPIILLQQKGGIAFPESEGRQFRDPAFRIQIGQKPRTVYFRVVSKDAMNFGLEVASPAQFEQEKERSGLFFGVYFGAIGVMAVYNLFVYFGTRERAYRSYVFFTFTSLIYFLSQTGYAGYLIYPDKPEWLYVVNPTVACAYIFFAALFTRSFLKTATFAPWPDKILFVLMILSTGLGIISALSIFDFGSLAAPISLLALFVLTTMTLAGIQTLRAGYAPARFYVAAFAAFIIGAATFVLRILNVLPTNFFTLRGIQIGSLLEVTLLSLALADRLHMLRLTVEKNMRELEEVHSALEKSERKYRGLVEDSSDLIFSLDNKWRFITANSAAGKLLGRKPHQMVGTTLIDLVHEDIAGSVGYGRAVIKEKLDALNGGRVQFWTRLSSKMGEPVELAITLEKLGEGPDSIVLGKASRKLEDSLLSSLGTERSSYTIANYLSTADLLHHRVTRNLPRYFAAEVVTLVQLSLKEMIVNAIEHGNLGITFEEKTEAQTRGVYLDLLLERQKAQPYRDRKVRVDYSLNRERALFRVTDEGDGFDHIAMAEQEHARLTDSNLSHGRGIGIAKRLFDIVRFSPRGNQVVLIKYVK